MAAFQAIGGPCALSVVMNVDADNSAHVYSLIKTLAEVGIRSIKVAPIVKSNDGAENYAYHKPLVRSVRRQVALAVEDFPKVEISNGYKADFESYAKSYTWCTALQIRPVIGADLNVYSCQDKAYQEKGLLFSIKQQRFIDGWTRGDWKAKIDPARDCAHHCVLNNVNELLHQYFDVDPEHQEFV
jgi:sulfatase maturation enzyme AslB (radical SAM superfamily)